MLVSFSFFLTKLKIVLNGAYLKKKKKHNDFHPEEFSFTENFKEQLYNNCADTEDSF